MLNTEETLGILRRISTTNSNHVYALSPEVVFEDVQLDADPFDIEIGEVEDITEHDTLAKVVASNISAGFQDEKLYAEYKAYHEGVLAQLRVMLEHHFPGRWDLQQLVNTDTFKNVIVTSARSSGSVQSMVKHSAGLGDRIFDRIMIYFPAIIISNGRQQTTIKELYIILNLTYRGSLVGTIKCFRANKTPREYVCHYNHSHAKKINNDTAVFCLGSTPLETLVTELGTYQYDELKYDLLFQQLPDYLAWESLDGGPYIRMEELIKTQLSIPQLPSLSNERLSAALSSFIAARPELSIVVNNVNGRIQSVTINKTIELWRKLTEHVPSYQLLPYIEGMFESVYPSSNGNLGNVDIKRINSGIGATALIYKGTNLRLQIELNPTTETPEETKVELLADSRILHYVTTELSTRITKHMSDAYWYGIECNTKESGVSKN